ncbi:DUF2637 domain-containing protein [Sphaerisporangium rhizosphaerae]|uniref:DUF2637 domain-containing protein n=1 Tax=Sphaerisporangium rhizosphaerae TaxID=2269375 RepID=A0ABW2PFP5_9ACTN
MSEIRQARRGGDQLIRVSMTVVVLAVAAVAAWVSYWHAVAVIEKYGAEDEMSAHLVPATVDGMIYASSMVLLWCARYRLKVPALARWALALGIAATLAANILHGIERGPLAAALAAWPAIALVISYELIMWVVRSGRELADRALVNRAERAPADRARPERALPDRALPERALADSPEPRRAYNGSGERERALAPSGETRAASADPSEQAERASAPPVERASEAARPIAVAAALDSGEPASQVDEPTAPVTEPNPRAASPTHGDEPMRDAQSERDRRAMVAGLLAQDPGMTGAALARALGVHESTGRKYRREVLNGNGHSV